ncbi:MAG: hypothetical protein MUC92_08450 [Fimbriimonadaceae bacterium]|jgi:hypothetical protein|nr:hypothetical protein [Fimbriimonadaceae bacterium]
MITSLILVLMQADQKSPSDAKVVDLKDGYVLVVSASYSIEVPKGWVVSEETRWGQRKAAPEEGRGELGVMTAPPGRQTWDQLYRTSLYFILREDDGKATPYKVTKLENGLEAATFEVLNKEGFANRRYVLVRHPEKGLLALSVRIPGKDQEKEWQKHFERMVKSAKFLG